MYQLLIKTFVRDYKNTEDAHVREQYGTVCSIISIVCNIILVVFKLIFGTLVHSVSIVADGYNNLSDAGSNIATFFGFKLANKHPDAEHPYGHGRFEYITGLGISFLIVSGSGLIPRSGSMVDFAIEIPEMTTTTETAAPMRLSTGRSVTKEATRATIVAEVAITSFILSWAAASNAVELISLPALRLK